MPPANTNLDVNVLVSVNKRFINRADVKTILQAKHDWNTPGLCFKGKTVGRSTVNENVKYHVILDEAPGITFSLSCGCLKYIRRLEPSTSSSASTQSIPDMAATEDMLEDAIEGDNEEEEEIDLTSGGWTEGQVFVDSRLRQPGSDFCSKSTLSMNYASVSSPLDYFLFFLPLDHFHLIIGNTNVHARNMLDSWTDITFAEYLMWIALLTVMTVVKHGDRKAYWKQGSSHFTLTIDFSEYMSFKRFNDIMRMHVFEVPSKENQLIDPLYQIRSTISAFNCHMPMCISPGKYLVIDESMNQWLGIGMPNIKKVPRKPHPIGQEFKTLADCHTSCILRMDTVSDPVSKEFDDEPGMKKLTATVKRLVQPWFGSGRTVIADSWFGSPDMVKMLFKLGLFSIMQVCKRRYWPRGMPQTDIVEKVEEAYGSCYTMSKCLGNGSSLFTCAYRDQKVKAFVSSCSTTILTGKKVLEGTHGRIITIQRPEVAEEYETHKSSVDAANNLRDNMASYHDIISTERWEMRFFGFFLGICEANAFSSFRVFANDGKKGISHASFKDMLAWNMLKHCQKLVNSDAEEAKESRRPLRRCMTHTLVSMSRNNGSKRVRLACKTCRMSGNSGTRVEKSCSCNPDTPICEACHKQHLHDIWKLQAQLNNSL